MKNCTILLMICVVLFSADFSMAVPVSDDEPLQVESKILKDPRILHETGGNVVGFEIADLDGDKKKEIALLFDDHLEVGRFSRSGFEFIDSLKLRKSDDKLGIDRSDLDGDGTAELYLSVVHDHQLASKAVILSGKGLTFVENRIGYLLRKITFPTGKTALIGQRLTSEEDESRYISTLWRLVLDEGEVTHAEEIKHPKKCILFGFQPFGQGTSGTLFANLNSERRLEVVTADGTRLWQSAEKFGGTTISFETIEYSGGNSFNTQDILIKQRLEPAPGGGLLIPQNDGEELRNPYANFGPGRMVAMDWQDGALKEIWRTGDHAGGVIDYRVEDVDNDGQAELVMLVIDTPPKASHKGRASLVVYELRIIGGN